MGQSAKPVVAAALLTLCVATCNPDRATAPPDGLQLDRLAGRATGLQAVLDACPAGSTCVLPSGVFSITQSLRVDKPLSIVGAGGARSHGGRRTEIRVVAARAVPALIIAGAHDVRVSGLTLALGGIRFGGDADPCRGIDGPTDRGTLELVNLAIVNSRLPAVQFSGGSLRGRSVQVKGGVGTGIYVAAAQGDVVMEDFEASHRRGWGMYICNRTGNGIIFLNGGHLDHNGRGGLAIVGGGGPAPAKRPACLQHLSLVGNARFGVMLVEAAVETLLFDVSASGTAPDADGGWGDGIAVGSSPQVVLWDVTSSHNARAGVSAFDCLPTWPTELLVLGDLALVENPISMDYEHSCAPSGSGLFASSEASSLINGCGGQFLAPPTDAHCVENGVTVACQAKTSDLAPPDPEP